VHLFVEFLEDRVGGEELVESGLLPFIESLRCHTQGGEVAPITFEIGRQMTRSRHEVVLDDPHDMEPVRHDAGVGKVAPDVVAVGT
jgi:hypothetical protein